MAPQTGSRSDKGLGMTLGTGNSASRNTAAPAATRAMSNSPLRLPGEAQHLLMDHYQHHRHLKHHKHSILHHHLHMHHHHHRHHHIHHHPRGQTQRDPLQGALDGGPTTNDGQQGASRADDDVTTSASDGTKTGSDIRNSRSDRALTGSGVSLTFGEAAVPERLLRTPLQRSTGDQKAYYSFVNPALVPSLTDFQMQTKGKDEWYLDSEGLSHLYEVPPVSHAKQQPACSEAKLYPRAIKNVTVLSVAFMFVLTAFVSLQTLQSSMHHANGLGVASLSCVYAATVVSCLLAPAVIRRLTTKGTLVVAFSLVLAYIACHFWPVAALVLPASVLLGLLTGPLWSAQATYLTTLAIHHAAAHRQLQDATINRFNAVFTAVVQTSQIWGNLISTLVLSHDNYTSSVNGAINHANMLRHGAAGQSPTLPTSAAAAAAAAVVKNSTCAFQCGAMDCGLQSFPDVLIGGGAGAGMAVGAEGGLAEAVRNSAIQHTVSQVPSEVRMLLLGVQLACAITGLVLVTSLLDRNSLNTTEAGRYPGSLSSQQLFSATFKMLQDRRLQLLLPLVVFTGLEQGFVFGEFTKSYVNCALGIHTIGSVMMCFGAMTALSALFIGAISRHIKRFAIMTSGTLFTTGLLIVLLWWKPHHDDIPMFYVIASCLGLCDAIWQTQTNTLFGVLFAEKQEAGFASYRMLQAVGFAVSFGYSHFLCVSTKLYIIAVVLLVALLLYSVVEVRLYHEARARQEVVVL